MVAFMRFFQRVNLDLLGFSTSALCAIHCLAFPFLIIFGSVGGVVIAHNHILENLILAISGIIGFSSLIPSYVNHHNRVIPLAIFLAGLTGIIISRFNISFVWEALFTTTGAGLVSVSHVLNWRYCRAFCHPSRSKQ